MSDQLTKVITVRVMALHSPADVKKRHLFISKLLWFVM